MNRPLIQKIIDVLEGRIEPVEKLGFDMTRWASQGECGTTACLAGWAVALGHPGVSSVHDLLEMEHRYGRSPYWFKRIPEEAQRLLDIRFDVAGDLFYGAPLTRKQAAKVLKHLLKTGAVDWSVA